MEIVAVEEYWDEIVKSRATPFVGLLLRVPPRFWREMFRIQTELKSVDLRHVYAKPSTLHVTIKGLGFLGKFNDGKLESILAKISSIVSGFSPFTIRFRGLGVFPTSIYAAVEDEMDQLRMMNKMITQELGSDIDASEYDGDSYIPHVTLLTFTAKDVEPLLQKVNSQELKRFDFGECRVFEVEAVEANMFFALGPGDTQDKAFSYLRSFQLSP